MKSVLFHGHDRPMIHLVVEQINSGTTFLLPIEKHRLNRRRTTILGQKRGVHSQRTFRGKVEDALRNDLGIGSHDKDLSLKRSKHMLKLLVELLRLKNFDSIG